MRTIHFEPSFQAWRQTARQLLDNMVEPRKILWSPETLYPDETHTENQLLDFDVNEAETAYQTTPKHKSTPKLSPLLSVPKHFISLAQTVSAHRSGKQWATLYEVLWKITYGNDRKFLQNRTDSRIGALENMRKQISRDIHKMRAFVRFKQIEPEEPITPNREHYVAWFEPDHLIVKLNASFFRKRFAGMNFSILTPDECMHWNGSRVEFTAGVNRSHAPENDELDELWKGYYRSIFNPARVKIKMMQTEMPKKYWKNLPEAEIIEELIQESSQRVDDMMQETNRPLKPRPNNKYLDHLDQLNQSNPDTPPSP